MGVGGALKAAVKSSQGAHMTEATGVWFGVCSGAVFVAYCALCTLSCSVCVAIGEWHSQVGMKFNA